MGAEDIHAGRKEPTGWPGYKFITCAGLAVTIGLPLLALLAPTVLGYFNGKLYDEFLLRITPGRASHRILIVDVDENSLREHGQWPWPRYKMATLLDRLNQAGAAAIGLDILFPEKDRTSLAIIQENLRHDLNLTLEFQSSDLFPDNDRLLADAISRSPAVLGYQFLFDLPPVPSDCGLHPLNLTGGTNVGAPAHFQWNASRITCNLRLLTENAGHSGFFNVSPDADGILRSAPLIMAYGDQFYPSLALASVMKALKIERIALTRRINEYDLVLGRTTVPLDPRGGLLIKYRGRAKTFPYISAADLLAGRVPEAALKDKIVFVSTSAAGLKEFRSTPTDPLFPGVEVHATIADNLLTADFLHRPASAPGIEFMAALLCGMGYVCATAKSGALRSFLLFSAGAAGIGWISFRLFDARGVFISPMMPLLVLTADFSLLNLLKFRREEHKSRQQTRDLALAQAAIIESLAALTETRDPETGGHIKRTQAYVRLLAGALRKQRDFSAVLTDDMVDLLYQSAPLHDIGKVGVPDRILLKPGRFSEEEFAEIKRHTTIGRDVIAAIQHRLGERSFLSIAHEITSTHHEKWDGSGYPQGLQGEKIPLSGRLMAIADMYDALTSGRVYKEVLSHEEAVRVMSEHARESFDPRIFKTFLEIQEDFHQVARRLADPSK
ncbi:MAG: CHASE2 domain-containing protein [Desulfobacteraceae bacterium]|nr:MAG: CHASE2 domain-containing protein [Desulfobacteraceae bacterium]